MLHTLEITGWRDCLTFSISFSYNMPFVSSSFFHGELFKLSLCGVWTRKACCRMQFFNVVASVFSTTWQKVLVHSMQCTNKHIQAKMTWYCHFSDKFIFFYVISTALSLSNSIKSLLIHRLQFWMAWGVEISKYSSLVDQKNTHT